MSLPDLNPEQAVAMLRQERLQWVDQRASADEKVRIIEAQLAGAELVLQIQARAAAAAEAAAASAATEAEADVDQAFTDGFAAGEASAEANATTEG